MENHSIQTDSVQTGICHACGAALEGEGHGSNRLCNICEAKYSQSSLPAFENLDSAAGLAAPQAQPSPIQTVEQSNVLAPIDPDSPHWGVGVGTGVWIFSVAAIFVFQIAAVFIWIFVEKLRGHALPAATQEDLENWIATPSVILASVIAIIFAHLLTLAVCWMVVTGFGRRPFFKSLGWHWAGMSWLNRILLVIGVVAGMSMVMIMLTWLLPDTQVTPFEQMLKSSRAVRIVIVALAVLTAPLVEEAVYRGVLYSALRKRMGITGAVMIVSLLFPLVHVPQYKGAWAGIIGLTLLSTALTVIRASTKSLLPCVVIHMVFNAVGSLEILRGAWQ